MAGPFESAAGAGGNSAAAAGLMRGFAEGLRDKSARDLKAELDQREKLAKEFQRIADDSTYDRTERDAAERHHIVLNMLDLTKKRPKEYQPDKAYGGIPQALFDIKWRKVQKEGPKQPPDPRQPPDPADPSAIPAPPPVDLTGLGTADLGANESVPPGLPPMPDTRMPAMPGGQQLGPNQIAAAPAVPGMPPPAGPSLEPMPFNPSDFESTRMNDPEVARREADLARIKNSVSLTPDATGSVDARALPAIGRANTLALGWRKFGLRPDGTPIPDAEKTDAERGKEAHMEAQSRLLDAQEAYSRTLPTRDAAKIQMAREALDVARQNANTAQSRVGIEAALYGGLLGGGAQGFLGGPDMGQSDPVASLSEQILTNQIEFSSVPAKLKPLVSLKIAQRGGVIVPEKLQGKLMQYTEAREAVDTIYNAIQSYVDASGTENLWAAYNLKSKVDGLTRIVGRAMGEKGVFTDADKADFANLLSPGTVLTLSSPERAKSWVGQVEGILTRIEDKQLQGFYQRVYAKKDQTLDTLRPGDKKNVVAELGGDETPKPVAARPAATTPAALPPIGQRVAGVTHATIGGVDRVWDGSAWVKPKK